MNYYNEIIPELAQWIQELMNEQIIPQGDIDTRDIRDVPPDDLRAYTQCHFFAGIGGWAYALRLAGWREDRPIWTGSCPCQPFSVAGRGQGVADPRHLWPAFRWLVSQCRPPAVAGEQVAQSDGRNWLSGVRADLEALGYEVGGADLCAAGLGAPHIRQRLFWMGYASGHDQRRMPNAEHGAGLAPGRPGRDCGMADAAHDHRRRRVGETQAGVRQDAGRRRGFAGGGGNCGMADGHGDRRQEAGEDCAASRDDGIERDGSACGMADWQDSIWWPCQDAKLRRVPTEPSLQPLADGIPENLVDLWTQVDQSMFPLGAKAPENKKLLMGAGNAIVPAVAANFLMAAEQARQEQGERQ